MTDQTFHIRRLNDMTRTQPEIVQCDLGDDAGRPALLNGDNDRDDTVLPAPARVAALRAAIATFNDWSEGNDPMESTISEPSTLRSAPLFQDRLLSILDHDTLAPVPSSIELSRVLTSCWLRNTKWLPGTECLARLLRLRLRSGRPSKATAYWVGPGNSFPEMGKVFPPRFGAVFIAQVPIVTARRAG